MTITTHLLQQKIFWVHDSPFLLVMLLRLENKLKVTQITLPPPFLKTQVVECSGCIKLKCQLNIKKKKYNVFQELNISNVSILD